MKNTGRQNTASSPLKGDKPRFVLKKCGPRKFKVMDTRTGNTLRTCKGTKKESEKFLGNFVSSE